MILELIKLIMFVAGAAAVIFLSVLLLPVAIFICIIELIIKRGDYRDL